MPIQKSIVLIHPPVSIPSAPPAGIARIAGFLREADVRCSAIDLNMDGLSRAAGREIAANDTWTRRAKLGFRKNLAALRSPSPYGDIDRYKRVVHDVNRVLRMAGAQNETKLSLTDYAEPHRSPFIGRDLRKAALDFENNLFFPIFREKITEALSGEADAIAGVSVNFVSQALCSAAVAGFIRKTFPGVKIVFGGGLITSWMNLPGFSNPLEGIVDVMVPGPGETVLAGMCGIDLRLGRGHLPGYPYDFDIFEQGAYLSPSMTFPIAASDGCYWRKCAFCPEREEKKPYRPFSPGKVASVSSCRIKPGLIHYVDNALSPKFMRHVIDNPPGTPWYGFARITHHLADPRFVAGLAASGCVMLQLGIESGDQEVLDAMGKGISVAMASNALKTLKAGGISVYGYLLFGTPAEDEKSALKTLDFIGSYSDCIDFLNLAIFNLPAHGALARNLETRPFYKGDLSLYREFVHPKGWDRNHVRRFLSKNFQPDQAVRRIILNDPPFFGSNHAPFFRLFRSLSRP